MHHMNETRDIIEVTFTLHDVIEKKWCCPNNFIGLISFREHTEAAMSQGFFFLSSFPVGSWANKKWKTFQVAE